MKKLGLLGLAAAMAVSSLLHAEPIEHNRRLGDVMLMLLDQVGGLGELSKAAPATLEDKVFNRGIGRARGAQVLIDLVKEKSGAIEEGKIVADELTPGALLAVQGDALVTMKTAYEKALDNVKGIFSDIEKELNTQFTKAAAQRDFRPFKLLMVKLDGAIKESHKAFKPEH